MINLETFKAGHYEEGYGYKYFVPNLINQDWIWSNPTINHLLEKAALKLGELNSFSKLVPNIDLFIQLHVTKEAVVSSRIEGTQTRMDEALLPETEIKFERKDDWKEVQNYIKAISEAIKSLETLPISSRLIRNTHRILLDSVRGEHKLPGEFRTSQNWIGGKSLADAKFIPPSHQFIGELMGDLETFLNNDQIHLPSLLKIAIAHYQFETIHPFLDGNGRIGRLLITLFLVKEKVLDMPLLYLSTFFENPKDLYYDNLSAIRTKNDMTQWIKYFLVGIEQTASTAVKTLSSILQFKREAEDKIRSTYRSRSTNAIILLQKLLKNPYITVDEAAKICDITYNSANTLVKMMVKDALLTEITGQNRNRFFVCHSYLSLFE